METSSTVSAPAAQDIDLKRLLTAEEILNAKDIEYVTVVVPEWKGSVRLRTLSAEEVADYVEATTGPAKTNAMALMLMRSAVKEDDSQLFADVSKIEQVRKRSMRAFMRLQDACLELNGLTEKAKALAKNV